MQESNRNFKGIWIPRELWLSKELSIGEKVMLAEIDSLEDEKKGCYCSNKYLSEFFGLSPDRVSSIISKLVQKGYIKTNYVPGKPLPANRILRIVKKNMFRGLGENAEGVRRKHVGGLGENAVQITKVITKDISINSEAVKQPWKLEQKLEEMEKTVGNDMDILATFFREKGFEIKNEAELKARIVRWRKKAREIVPLLNGDMKKFFKAVEVVKEESYRLGYTWDLGTICKKLNSMKL